MDTKQRSTHILIAEDDLTSRTILAAVLQKSGYKVVETTDGRQAWEVLQQPEAPALAILDWMMPRMSGLEVVRRVRALETERPPYLLMLTTKGEKADIIAGLDAGANDYLAKPFDAGELRARVAVGCRMIEMQEALIESRQALSYQATHDSLTGMYNRRAILDQLRKELDRAARNGEAVSIGMCDIDHFKRINDTHGHQTGDEVLCAFGRILQEGIRPYDSAGRMGGEEFLVIAPVRPGRMAMTVFERLRRALADTPIETRSGPISISISIGVASATVGGSVDRLLAAADAALYQAKARGRNRVVCEVGARAAEVDTPTGA
ncbi:MAG: diguanylate cyclase [Desulfatitalea sp.]|nr:diguanylate cyclase [Desulfatitalea sp.]